MNGSSVGRATSDEFGAQMHPSEGTNRWISDIKNDAN